MDAALTVQAAVRAALQTAGSDQLVMRPVMQVSLGQLLAARVVGAGLDGQVELAVAGQRVVAQTEVPLEPGQRVRLQVSQADDARITLRIVPDAPGTARGGAPSLPGLPPAAARALMAALSELPPGQRPDPSALTSLAGRAVAAGVQTPAQADAFVRLAAAGLPTTPAAVAGLAELAEGPQLGRALVMVAEGLRAQAQAPAPAQAAVPGPPGQAPAQPGAGATAQSPAQPAAGQAPAPGVPIGNAGGHLATPPAPGAAPAAPLFAGPPAQAAAPQAPAGPAGGQPPAPAPAAAPTPPPLPANLAALTALVEDIARRAVGGDGRGVRRAVADLGHGQESRLRAGEAPEQTLRSLLLGIAADPETPQATARLAERTADALAAQSLVPPTTTPAADPSAQGAYLQIPLPGGQSAEVRVMPDQEGGGHGGEGGRGTRIAFLLTMSSLGQMVVEATVGPNGTDAVVRSASEPVREYLAGRTAELADALSRAGGERPARVGVDRMPAGEGNRMLPGPPPSGLDISA